MADPPNILIVMSDQQRPDFSSHEGYPLDTTPALDRLVDAGVGFQRAYTPTPICLPARCSLFTGRFPTAHGMRSNFRGTEGIRYTEDLLDIVKKHGYATGLLGKNHSHRKREAFDWYRGYNHRRGTHRDDSRVEDEAFDGFLDGLNNGVATEPTPFDVHFQFPVRIVQDTLAYFKAFSEKPKFAWVSFPEPHSPYQVPEPYFSMFQPDTIPERAAGPEILSEKGFPWDWQHTFANFRVPGCVDDWRRYRANYLGMIRLIDDQIQVLLDGLGELGEMENTYVIFLSDHGDYAGDYGLPRKGVGLPEVLVRVPMIWTGPGVQPSNVGDHPFVSLVDIFPTVCELLGEEIPFGVQGRSLLPILKQQTYPEREFASIFAEYGYGGLPLTEVGEAGYDRPTSIQKNQQGENGFDEINDVTNAGAWKMVRKGDWKLAYMFRGKEELYHVRQDPYELENKIEDPECAAIRDDLRLELIDWMVRIDETLPFNRYTMDRDVIHNYTWDM